MVRRLPLADSDGSVPLWEAILGKHEGVIKILMDNGADLGSGDVGNFSCMAAEQNSLELLQEIVRYGGDVTLPRVNGSTALHLAVCEGNAEAVRFLLDQGADPERPDANGWTPRELADQQSHEEIKALFEERKTGGVKPAAAAAVQEHGVRFVGMFRSEPSIRVVGNDGGPTAAEESPRRNQRRRKTNNFHNSLFGIMSAAQEGEKRGGAAAARSSFSGVDNLPQTRPLRVTISCPQAVGYPDKLVLLPGSLRELLDLGMKKFGVALTRVLTEEGAEVDDVGVIRDGDRLVLQRQEEEPGASLS